MIEEDLYVEPTEKVLNAIKTAMETIGRENFIIRVKVESTKIDDWMKRAEYVPIRVIYEACKINMENNKPYNSIQKVVEGAKIIIKSKGGMREEARIERKATIEEMRRERIVFRYMMTKSIILLLTMIPLIVLGYFLGRMISEFYAGIGMTIGVFIWLIIITVYLLTKKDKYKM
ncbi:MAG: hypothetical protein NDF57_01885 [archaeon GBS-70-058]|nr:hypothetical protein [Candidatus Culexarchaeum nevadense]